MLVTLVSQEKIFSLHLPEKYSGKYWIIDDELPLGKNRLLSIEADEAAKKWVIHADKYVELLDQKGIRLPEIYLEEGKLYPIRLGKAQQQTFLFAEPFTEDRSNFPKYKVKGNAVFAIGSRSDAQIVIQNHYVSADHASLSYDNGVWTLFSYPNTNGTYVNRRKVKDSVALQPGDTVFILGCKIVVGSDFLSLNNPDKKVRLNTDALTAYTVQDNIDDEILQLEDPVYYYRSPRIQREIIPIELKVDSPTRREDGEDTPILLTLAPALLMGVASFSTGIISIVNARNSGGSMTTVIPTMVTSISMLAGMVLFPFFMRKRERRRKKEKEADRREKYTKYLNNLREEIRHNQLLQEEVLRELNPPILELAGTQDFWEHGLWCKSPEQPDYLYLRLGCGNAKIYGNIVFPDNRFSIEDDALRDALFAFQREEHLLMNVPIGVSLLQQRVLGIVGDHEEVCNLLNNILLQLTLLHSYDEVKLILLYEKKDEGYLSYIRFVQHLWDDEGRSRFLAVSEENMRELAITINKLMRDRAENNGETKQERILPEYVLVAASKDLANRCPFMDDILTNVEVLDLAVICAYDELKSLPKECHTVVELSAGQGQVYSSAEGGKKNSFAQDPVSSQTAESLVRRMLRCRLDLNRGRYDLPGMVTFMDMYGVGKYEHLNIPQRWKRNDPVKSLQAPIGVDTNGETFYLDLHEKFHGPHGLVAGMTGSGKSEFIITYILSMAVNYHPDEVAFVLIDYKGGGLTGAFDTEKYRLPHLAGTITNLDGGAIMRSILSIRSELRRRQTVFNEAREIANEGTMDIYKYQKMYRDGLVKDPLPHLIIISDEFAELKSQQPEFLDQLVSTARIGRSLGVHLILATQKPAGVVSDQIWANSKFKVCLKVQDRADSMDMLKKPDAAGIAETGRFFLQVGYDELFEKGQSAWAGAPYLDTDVSGTELDSSIEVVDELGNVVDRLKEKRTVVGGDHGKQIVRIMEYLDALAKEEGIHERQLWMPEIPADVRVDSLIEKYHYVVPSKDMLCAVVGELDDPYQQRQDILAINFSVDGNALLFGAAGSGDELFVNALLYSMYSFYSPRELNTYLLDFGAETLKMFEEAPQTGGVVLDGETEKMASFYSQMQREVKRRKKLLVDYAGEMKRYNEIVSEEERLPFIFVVINNYSHYSESYESYEDVMISLIREGTKYGIYFLITGSSAGAIRYRITQHFQQMYVLQLNDVSDYTSILGRTGGMTPSSIKGRGMLKRDEVYIFQSAHIVGEEEDLLSYIKEHNFGLRERFAGQEAVRIATVSHFISGQDMAVRMQGYESLPLGISYDDYRELCHDLQDSNVLMVAGMDSRANARYAAGLLEMLAIARPDASRVVLNGNREISALVDGYEDVTKEQLAERVVELFNTGVARNNDFKKTEGHPSVDMTPTYVLVYEYGKLKEALDDDKKDKLSVLMSKVEGFCNMYFIVVDQYRNMGNYNLESWYADRCAGNGLWVGNGVGDQIRFNIRKKDKSLDELVDERTGYYMVNGMARRLRLMQPAALEQEAEDEE